MSSFVLQVRNFQRIKNAKLEFIPGLNVIVGQSNQGKTALFRAIQSAVFNSSRESYTTIGETKTAVGIRYQGHEVIWRRDNNRPSPVSYRVDGKILEKLGRGQPEVIAEVLGIREVELDNLKLRLNFQKQMEYPFLLDKTPSQLFKFIVQSAEEDNVMDVVHNMKSDAVKMQGKVTALEETRDELKKIAYSDKGRYDAKKDAVPVCDRVLDLDSKVKKYSRLKSLVEEFHRLSKKSSQLSEVLKLLEDKLTLFAPLESMEETFEKISFLNKEICRIGSLEEGINRNENSLGDLNERLQKFEKLESLNKSILSVESKQGGVDKLRKSIDGVKRSSEIVDDLGVSVKLKEQRIVNLIAGLSKLNSSIVLVDEISYKKSKIESLMREVSDFDTKCVDYSKRIGSVDSKLEGINRDLSEFKVCPYCGNELGECDEC